MRTYIKMTGIFLYRAFPTTTCLAHKIAKYVPSFFFGVELDMSINLRRTTRCDFSLIASIEGPPTSLHNLTGFYLSSASRYVIARVYGLTNDEQKRYTTKFIGDKVSSISARVCEYCLD